MGLFVWGQRGLKLVQIANRPYKIGISVAYCVKSKAHGLSMTYYYIADEFKSTVELTLKNVNSEIFVVTCCYSQLRVQQIANLVCDVIKQNESFVRNMCTSHKKGDKGSQSMDINVCLQLFMKENIKEIQI